MSNELCPYCGNEPIPTGAGAKVMCNNLKCPIYAHECSPGQWDRRFVRLDKNGDKVFAGDEVKLTIDDSSEGKLRLLACFIDGDSIPLPIEWIREDTDRRGLPLEIELIKEKL